MYRFLLAGLLSFAVPAAAANWIEYKVGPFHVFSDAGDKLARDRLNEMEQLRHALGIMLGKDSLGVGGPSTSQLETVWPIYVVLFAHTNDYAPHAIKTPFVEGGSALLSAQPADAPLPRDILRALTQMLIYQNANGMAPSIETALIDLFSTIKVTGTKIMLGAPPPEGELDAKRLHAWAKLQLLTTSPEYSGKLRVYLNNLQGVGDEALATRNAYGLTVAQLNQKVDEYVRAGKFEAAPVSGEAINPREDFIEKPVGKDVVDELLTELASDGKTFLPDSPRGLVEKNTRESLEEAAKANPRWGEPYYRLADLEIFPDAERVKDLKMAVKLDPRNVVYWRALAEAQTATHLYADAEKSWVQALKAAPDDAERERIRKVRLDLEEKRAEWEAAEKKRIAEEEARDLQRLKNSAAAEVHAAEAAANKQAGALDSKQKPVEWWGDPAGEKISGSLARVDCLAGGLMRLSINIDGGGSIKLLIRDPKSLAVRGDEVKFVCGGQRPVRKVRVIYNVKADAKLDTVGEIAMVEFP